MVFCEDSLSSHLIEIGCSYGTDLPRQLLPKTYELNGNVDAFKISTALGKMYFS